MQRALEIHSILWILFHCSIKDAQTVTVQNQTIPHSGSNMNFQVSVVQCGPNGAFCDDGNVWYLGCLIW